MAIVTNYERRCQTGRATGTIDGLPFEFRDYNGTWELVVREPTDRFAKGSLVAEAFGHFPKKAGVCVSDVLTLVQQKLATRGNKTYDAHIRDIYACPIDYPEDALSSRVNDTAAGVSGAFLCKDNATYDCIICGAEEPLAGASPELVDAKLRVDMFSEAYDDGNTSLLYHYFSLSDWREWSRLNKVVVKHLVYIPENRFRLPAGLPGIFDAEDEREPQESDLNRYRHVCTLQEKYDIDFDLKKAFDTTPVDELMARIAMAEYLKEEGITGYAVSDYRLCLNDIELDDEQYLELRCAAGDYEDTLMYAYYTEPHACESCGSTEKENDCCDYDRVGWD